VLTLDETFDDPHIRAREMVVRENGTLQFAPPWKISEYEFAIERPAPEAGQHTEEILREAGYASADISRLRGAGVI
jgi:crotonobetainyl-CoA:carnitine CoA-transferase CaiB-like acyl-CoA transferase